MLEVRPGLLLGSIGDAEAVYHRVPSVTKQYTVTHILSLTNETPEWVNQRIGGGGEGVKDENVAAEGVEDETVGDEGVKDESVGEKDEGEGGRSGKSGGGRCAIKTMHLRVADMPQSDLLHHFESCAKFIKEGVEQGTVLVHCEYGISRSVTVVLAYLMWSEGLSFRVLFQQLKEQKPEVRPNSGFIEQLKLWEEMRCRINENNKPYKAYRLKQKAQEMKDTGYVESMSMSPDPFLTQLESTAYFRCRKCRRLLFTDESVLQHELGKGQAAFKWHKRVRQDASPVILKPGGSKTLPTAEEEEMGEAVNQQTPSPHGSDQGRGESTLGAEMSALDLKNEEDETEAVLPGPTSPEQVTISESAVSRDPADQISSPPPPPPPSSTESDSPPPFSPTELAKVRAQAALVVALGNQPSTLTSPACSSYFIEPVEWMGPLLLGSTEGKILCPKCHARLGSFSWAGEQCSCGQWVTPSFQVHRSRVDETRTLTRRKSVPKHT